MTADLRDKLPVYAALVIVTLCVGLYGRGLGGPFIFDDKTAIEYSPHVRSLWPLAMAMSGPDESATAGRPVLCLSLALNHSVHGLDVRGYHAVNIALHAATALLLMAVVGHTLRCMDFGEHADVVAAAAALLWAIHPLNTESVQYIVQRSELLFGFFLMLTLHAFIRGRRTLAVLACLLGMGSKEVMAVAPLLVLLYDRTFESGSFAAAWRRHRWMYAAMAATWLPLAWLVLQGPRDQSVGPRDGITMVNYLLTQAGVLVHYLRLSVWPRPLSIVYAWPIASSVSHWLLPGLSITGLLVLTGCGVWRNRWYGFVGAWCFLILAPTSSVVPMTYEIVAERRMYLPLAALIAMTVAAASRLRLSASIAPAAAMAIVALLATLTWQRVADYRSERAIWSDAVARQPTSHVAQQNMGYVLQREGDLNAAIRHYRAAVRLRRDYRPAWLNMANCQLLQHRFDDAIATYRLLLSIDADYPPAHNNLGLLLARTGRKDEALRHFTAAVEAEPRYTDAHVNLAALLAERGRRDEARRHLDVALQLSPEHFFATQLQRSMAQVAEVPVQ